jgi:predicted chitinase
MTKIKSYTDFKNGLNEATQSDELRDKLAELGYAEKSSELSSGGDITDDIQKIAEVVLEEFKKLAPSVKVTVTGGNDAFHHNLSYVSRHTKGQAIDLVISPNSDEAHEQLLSVLNRVSAGTPGFSYIDEYTNPTAAATAGHFHLSYGKTAENSKTANAKVEDPITVSGLTGAEATTSNLSASGIVIDPDLIKRLVAKLKEKNFSQADLDKYSIQLTAGKGANFKAVGAFPEANMKALEKSMDKQGITNEFARKAILGVISKESAKGGSETSYFSTPISRMKEVFGNRISKYSDEEIESWRQLGKAGFDSKFWEAVYGGMYGNTEPGDGEKYRGRGFNGITFKGNYENLQKIYNKSNQTLGSIDIVKNPELLEKPDVAAEFAILYFVDTFKRHNKNPNDYSDLDSAVTDYIRANAGWGTSLDGAVVSAGLQKAKAFASSLDSPNIA